jgi:hypothetical protein
MILLIGGALLLSSIATFLVLCALAPNDPENAQPPLCFIYGKPCLGDGHECDYRCLREVSSAEDSDPAADYGDWRFHQDHDQ